MGRGSRRHLAASLAGQNIMIVTTARGRQRVNRDPVLRACLPHSCVVWMDSIVENPGLADLQAMIDALPAEPVDVVLAIGGGSVMDAGKVLALAQAPQCQGVPLKTLIASPDTFAQASPPRLFAVPTTAGTGSEVTPFATVWDHAARRKLSLAGQGVYPHAAVVDPALTDALPLEVTLSTGLDAINQAAESVWNRHANAATLALAVRALQSGFAALPALIDVLESDASAQAGALHDLRDAMAHVSLLAGLAISHTRTALCHSLSYPLTAHFGVAHGLACAFTMPAVLRHNLRADDGRFKQLAQALTGTSRALDLVPVFDGLHLNLQVAARLRKYVPDLAAMLALSPEMFTPGRADNSLQPVTQQDVQRILTQAWHMD